MAQSSFTIRPGDWQRLRDIAKAYRQALETSGGADLKDFLPPEDDRLRSCALEELIKADLEFHWERGSGPLLDDYLTRYPELGPMPALPATLICREYELRKRFGDKPELHSYQQRFPDQFSEVVYLAGE